MVLGDSDRETQQEPDEHYLFDVDNGVGITVLQALPTRPDYTTNRIDIIFTELIYTAHEDMAIATPYFIPNEALLQALKTVASRRGTITPIAITTLSGMFAACSTRPNASLQDPANQEQVVSSSDENIGGPDFTIIKPAGGPASFTDNIELRRHEPVVVAETTVQAANRDAASSMGFRPLAAFIFGKIRPSAEIAMTAPVTTSPENRGKIAMTAPVTTRSGSSDMRDEQRDYTVRFIMPAKYTLDTLPKPVDPAIRIVPMPARKLVA